MQPLVLHPLSLTTTQFGQPRFSSGPERRLLNRSWSSNARGRSPRASFTRQSMSDSPTEEPSVTPRESNPVGYPPASSPVVTPAGENTTPTSISISHPYSVSGRSQLLVGLNDPPSATLPLRYGEQAPPVFVGSPRLPPAAPQYPLPALDPSLPSPVSRSLTQKSTRRTKAHVASACVNCKKKHLGCDPARPCRRCVLSGKASSCVDVTHKKRGRPPLKAEDSSLRSYTTHVDNPAVPAESHSSTAAQRTSLHRTTSSRELRPMTDLHAAGDPGGASGMRVPQGQLRHRWSASVFPLTRPMEYSQHIQAPAGRRPYTSSGPPSYPPLAPPPHAFVTITNGYNPPLPTTAVPPGMERRYAPYATSALPLPTSPPHVPTGVPYLPYETPSNPIHHPMHDPRISGPRDPYVESPVRLPPIHQATASPGPPGPPLPGQVPSSHQPPSHHHAHRLSDPYPANWTSFGREQGPRHHRSESILQRPSTSIFSHSTGHQRSVSTTDPSLLDPVPRHLGPVDLSPSITQGHSPTVTTRPAPPNDPERDESRPVKRRKMALDDMVNG
ncbi:hypothetical protein N7495_006525 [Penicillium taxi]|uniref:uncharacterized protein n=1 Tax=Penicillium taxi TaxID=168475 RepID=UPI002545BB44|nr:uncharacterized protein N7495_006525 [Penicillium taxi]KAJ5894834.1 hypothetical protein N7495_006525 [Penicillium taxi]